MCFSLTCSLALIFGSWTTVDHPDPAAESRPVAPAEQFSDAVVGRVDAGWGIGVIDVVVDGAELHLEVTVATRTRAERLTLAFDRDGRTPLAFDRAAVTLPAQTRRYANASELVGTLRRGPVQELHAECGSYYVDSAAGGASVDPHDYYTVRAAARGKAAPALLRNAIAGAIADDRPLAGVLPTAVGYDLVFLDDGEQIVHVELDDAGAVVAAQVRWSPMAYRAWARTYQRAGALEAALANVERVVRVRELRSDSGGEARYELVVGGGAATYVIDVADFAIDGELEDFGCGC